MKWWVLGGLVALLAIALGVQGWRESQRPAVSPPVHHRYKPGHRWYYKHRLHEDASTLVICKVEPDERHGVLVHVAVEGLKLDTPKGTLEELAHLPMTAAALDASVTRLAAVHQPLPKWLDAYERWQAVYTGTQVITTSVADGVSKTEASMQRAGR